MKEEMVQNMNVEGASDAQAGYKPDICIHHMPCADGFTAAWAVWKRWPDIQFHPGVYGEAPPEVEGLNVLIVDFSYKRAVMSGLYERASSVTVLDHHKSAEADLAGFPNATFDMNKSGAMLAWEYCHPGEPVPQIVRYVQDRDLWRFELPQCREFAAYLFSFDYDFEAWDEIATAIEHPSSLQHCIASGMAIERKHHKDIAELLKLTTREMVIGGQRVKCANLPYTMSSDAANVLAEGAPFGACYYDNADGKRVFSLRSKLDGADVSDVAVAYGGGGHARAAGFTAPRGWEGDE